MRSRRGVCISGGCCIFLAASEEGADEGFERGGEVAALAVEDADAFLELVELLVFVRFNQVPLPRFLADFQGEGGGWVIRGRGVVLVVIMGVIEAESDEERLRHGRDRTKRAIFQAELEVPSRETLS